MVHRDNDFVLVGKHLLLPPVERVASHGPRRIAAPFGVFAVAPPDGFRSVVSIGQHQEQNVASDEPIAFPRPIHRKRSAFGIHT